MNLNLPFYRIKQQNQVISPLHTAFYVGNDRCVVSQRRSEVMLGIHVANHVTQLIDCLGPFGLPWGYVWWRGCPHNL